MKKITSWTRFKYVNPKVFIPDTIDDLKKLYLNLKIYLYLATADLIVMFV